ncbi:hypothetical protein PC116_g30915 [Phytophthora cactorum]|nr:hypothetical protein PC116_g30915 [Phytophthora cactorum]
MPGVPKDALDNLKAKLKKVFSRSKKSKADKAADKAADASNADASKTDAAPPATAEGAAEAPKADQPAEAPAAPAGKSNSNPSFVSCSTRTNESSRGGSVALHLY